MMSTFHILHSSVWFVVLLQNFLTRVSAAELDSRVTHMGNTLTVVLITQIHTVCVAVTPPTHGNAQPIHPTLELIYVTATWRTSRCRRKKNEARKCKGEEVLPPNITEENENSYGKMITQRSWQEI